MLACLATAAISIAFERSTTERGEAIQAAREAYHSSLTASRIQIAGLMSDVVSDRALKQNIDWELRNAVNRGLETKIQQGSLDQIVLFTAQCQRLGSASVSSIRVDCPTDSAEAFFWTTSATKNGVVPVLGLVRVMATKQGRISAVGLVALGQNWLHLHPKLTRFLHELRLEIQPESLIRGSALVREGISEKPNGQQEAIATLGTTRIWDGLLFGDRLSYGDHRNPLVWPALALAGFFGLSLWLQNGRRRERQMQRENALWKWSLDLTPGGEAVQSPSRDALEKAKAAITHAIQVKIDALRVQQQRQQELNSRLRESEQQRLELEKRVATAAHLQAIMLEQRSFRDQLTKLSHQLAETAFQLGNAVSSRNAQACSQLGQLLRHWQRGIEQRGSRKFIRSLAETIGQDGSSTLLDDQIGLQLGLVAQLSHMLDEIAFHSNEISKGSRSLQEAADLWAGSTAEDAQPTSWEDVFLQAQRLARLFLNNRCPRFEMPPAFPDRNCPHRAFATRALLHVYLYLIGDTEETMDIDKRTIAIRTRDDAVVMSIDTATKLTDGSITHLELAAQILRSLNVQVEELRTLQGRCPIALRFRPRRTSEVSTEDYPLAPKTRSEDRPHANS